MRLAKALTTKELRSITAPGFTAVGGVPGIYVFVRGNSKKFVFRFVSPVTSKASMVTLGDVSRMSLADARKEASRLRDLLDQGLDPAAEKRREKEKKKESARKARAVEVSNSKTFAALADQWLSERVKAGYYDKNIRGASVVRSYLDRTITPAIGHILIGELTPRDVFSAVKPLWATTTSAKDKCLRIISQVFRWAKAMNFVTGDNPADLKGPLGVLLENFSPHLKQPKNSPALDVAEIPDFFVDLMQSESIGAKALAFSILTASRSKPVRNAKWSDIDLKACTWACPEESMKVKGRGAFVVLLSRRAVELLKSLPRFVDTDLVFPSPYKHRPLTDAGLGKVITNMHIARLEASGKGWIDPIQSEAEGKPVKVTQHGTARATFKTWTRTGKNLKRFDTDAVEMCLAHKVNDKYNGAYDRASLMEERRRVMEAWGEFCFSRM